MKRYYDEEDNQFLLLEKLKLEQGLEMVYSVTDKVFIVVDPDVEKNYEGKPYTETIDAADKETGESVKVGIVQIIRREAVSELKEMFDYLELENL